MSWLKLKIGGRLGLGFSALLLLFAITNYIAIINMEKLADRTEMLYKHPFTVSTAVLRIRANVIKLYDLVEYYRLDFRHVENSTMKQQSAELNKKIEDAFDIILKRFLGNKVDIEKTYGLYKKWYNILLEENTLIAEKNLYSLSHLKSENYQHNLKLQEKINEFITFTSPSVSDMNIPITVQYQQQVKSNQSFLKIDAHIKQLNYLLLQFKLLDVKEIEQEALLSEIKQHKQSVNDLLADLNNNLSEQQTEMKSLVFIYQNWKQNFDQILMLSFNSERQTRLEQIEESNHALFAELNKGIDHINNYAKNKADLFLNNALQLKLDTLNSMYYLIGFIVFLIILFAILIIRSIVTPLHRAVDFAKRLSQGNLNSRVANKNNRRDETSELLQAMNEMASGFQNVIGETQGALAQLAQGNTDIKLCSDFVGDFDEIKTALYITAKKLGASNRENQQQTWLKTGQTLLNKQIQGKQIVATLSKDSLDFLVNYLECSVGLFYYCHQEDVPYLSICASYGYPKTELEQQQDKFYKGDGLVGQSLITKQILVREHSLEEYHCVPQSGLAWAIPKYVCIIPCCYENKVKAVIELGSFNGFSSIQQEFLQQVMPNIAIAINTLESHSGIERLLVQQMENDEKAHGKH